jgi:hypothetical protein
VCPPRDITLVCTTTEQTTKEEEGKRGEGAKKFLKYCPLRKQRIAPENREKREKKSSHPHPYHVGGMDRTILIYIYI